MDAGFGWILAKPGIQPTGHVHPTEEGFPVSNRTIAIIALIIAVIVVIILLT
jgi:hypothetical protein